MEKSLKAAKDYDQRAHQSINEAKTHLQNGFLESAVSTSYYACFYAIHSQMTRLGVEVSSHKQVGIEFRRHFIQNKKLPIKFSETWQKLFQQRMEADYAPSPEIDSKEASNLVQLAEEFVTQILKVNI